MTSLCLAGIVVVSAFIAAVLVRTPALWWLAPEWVMELSVSMVRPSNQEEVADAEFLGMWLTSLGVVALTAAASLSLVRISGRVRHAV